MQEVGKALRSNLLLVVVAVAAAAAAAGVNGAEDRKFFFCFITTLLVLHQSLTISLSLCIKLGRFLVLCSSCNVMLMVSLISTCTFDCICVYYLIKF